MSDVRSAVLERFPEYDGQDVELQVVHYRAGEFYKLHSDCGSRSLDGTFHRNWSMFVYLKGPSAATGGGGTVFPRLDPSKVFDAAAPGETRLACCEPLAGGGVRLAPPDGSALVWTNVDDFGRADLRALHAGEPLGAGEKWGLNVWLPTSPVRRRDI